MKKLKRTAAGLLLAGVLCVQALPMTAWAVDLTASDVVATDSDTAVTDTAPVLVEATTNAPTEVRCDIDKTDYFTFEDHGDVYEVTGTTEAFRELGDVNITFAENIRIIGEEAFKGTSLKSVDFECDEAYISTKAFSDCAKLAKVAFDKITVVDSLAFENCTKLTAVNLTNKKLRWIGDGAFSGCTEIEDVVISANDYNYHSSYGNGVGFGNGIFSHVGTPYKLTFQMNLYEKEYFEIPQDSFNDGRVKEVHFDGTGDVVVEQAAFKNSTQLQSFDFSNVVHIGMTAFYGCTNLQEINLSNKNMRSIGDYAFSGCGNANDIQLSLNDKLEIGENPFSSAGATNNGKPYNLTIYANNVKDYFTIPEDFCFGNTLLTNYEVVGDGKLYYDSKSFSYCKNLKTAKFGNADGFGKESFSYCKSLESANLISARVFGNRAFMGCSRLSSLKLGVYDGSQWSEEAFSNSMTEIVDADGNPISGTMELYMNNKETFRLGDSATINSSSGNLTFADMSFSNMNNLTTVKTYGDGELELCSIVSDGWVGRSQFVGCKNLKSFDFSNVTSIDRGSFRFCDSLTEAKITRRDTRIGDGAFLNNENLTLYGYTDSTTEKYANDNGIPFVALDGGKTTTATSTAGQGSTTTTVTTTKGGSDSSVLYGDTTLDGRVDISDAVLLNKATAGSVRLNEQASANADLYKDGDIDGNDSVTLLQFLVHQLKSLPVQP